MTGIALLAKPPPLSEQGASNEVRTLWMAQRNARPDSLQAVLANVFYRRTFAIKGAEMTDKIGCVNHDCDLCKKRPQNCGTGYCSCIECVMEPAPVQERNFCERCGKRLKEKNT
jgi:hypothetical protein